jgi:hypothetical protein
MYLTTSQEVVNQDFGIGESQDGAENSKLYFATI